MSNKKNDNLPTNLLLTDIQGGEQILNTFNASDQGVE